MATLLTHPKSPYWILQRKVNGKWVKTSTGLRTDDPHQTAQARELEAQANLAEVKKHVQLATPPEQKWESWVESFLKGRMNNKNSIAATLNRWHWLGLWLAHANIRLPSEIRYQHAIEYIEWRTNYRKKSKKKASKNTAIHEIKLLGLIMSEAVRRGYASGNPLHRIPIAKDEAREKPEISDEEFIQIREALRSEPEWMQLSFEIAANTGCRLRETRIHRNCINLKEKKITFAAPKGGKERAFSVPMPSALIELFEAFMKSKKACTLDFPFQPSRRWGQFFKKLNLSHLCFHCLRVSFVTRLHRAAVPLAAAMKLVNHSGEIVHSIYSRLGVDDVVQYRDVVQIPSSSTPKNLGKKQPSQGTGNLPSTATPSRSSKKRPSKPPVA